MVAYSDDNGYVDSSYEDLRSLAHEGSVFSIDILCHSTQEGSHRAQRIPLFVHQRQHGGQSAQTAAAAVVMTTSTAHGYEHGSLSARGVRTGQTRSGAFGGFAGGAGHFAPLSGQPSPTSPNSVASNHYYRTGAASAANNGKPFDFQYHFHRPVINRPVLKVSAHAHSKLLQM